MLKVIAALNSHKANTHYMIIVRAGLPDFHDMILILFPLTRRAKDGHNARPGQLSVMVASMLPFASTAKTKLVSPVYINCR